MTDLPSTETSRSTGPDNDDVGARSVTQSSVERREPGEEAQPPTSTVMRSPRRAQLRRCRERACPYRGPWGARGYCPEHRRDHARPPQPPEDLAWWPT